MSRNSQHPNLFSNKRLSGKDGPRTVAAITGEWDKRQGVWLKYCTKVEICHDCGGGRFQMNCLDLLIKSLQSLNK